MDDLSITPNTRTKEGQPSVGRPLIDWILGPLFKRIAWLYRQADRVFALNERGANRNLARLVSQVKSEYDFLFSKYGGRILEDESSGAPSMDHAIVVIAVRSLRLRAIRDRGETYWQVTSATKPESWQRFDEAVCRINPNFIDVSYSRAGNLNKFLPEVEKVVSSSLLP